MLLFHFLRLAGVVLLGLGLSCVAAITVPREAHAQIVNVLYEARDLKDGVGGKINAGGDWLDGNTNSIQGEVALGLHYRSGRHLGLLMFNAAYGEANDEAFLDRQMGHLRYRFQMLGPLQLESFLQSDRNPFRRRTLRTVFGAGPRWELFTGPIVRSSVGLAYMPEYETLDRGDFADSGRRRWRHRVSSYLSHSVRLGERVKLALTLYLQPALGASGDLRSFVDHSLAVDVLKNVALVFTHSLQVDTEPPDTVRPADASRKLTVTWQF